MTSLASAAPTEPWWESTPDARRLVLHLGERSATVPVQITAMLLKQHQPRSDAAADVLRMDAHVRDLEQRAADRAAADIAEYARLRRLLVQLGRSWFARTRRAEVRAESEKARDSYLDACRIHAETLAMKRALRAFVIAMEPQEGLLAEAAAGWARSPAVPAGVAVFEEVSYFLSDTRRDAAPDGPAGTIAGEDYGELWRREGDDPIEQPLARAGCWQVGYIARTHEIYAVRRCSTESREVWLLGRGFTAARAHDLLAPLMARMQEPNSLILVAEEVVSAAHPHPGGDA
ncbi:hypothetical protein NQK81_01000 [Amycolatopsis roodepoortensis]|uniref:hypothetical protein n=1 Tax=Amycolatopsis roodepoortensis TaxID=700274 RepID=UPI00214C3454|nr:hypothetical protein [Amycolatopsis roodepoortensis]UUV32054.1 hypothetical protein NQK81_01000 [Amycolatopsis roodepoortensis]